MTAQDLVVARGSDVQTPIDFKEALPRFQLAWTRTKEALFELLELIQSYQDRPGFEAFCEELEKHGIIKRSVMSMLTKIANSPVLMREEYRPLLPASYNTLWVLTAVEEKLLSKKLQSQQIGQDLTVEEARALKAIGTSKSLKPTAKSAPVIATIRLSDNAAKKHKSKLSRLLNSIESLGATVSRSSILE